MRHRFVPLLLLLAVPAALGQADPVLDTGPVQTELLPGGFVGADNGAGTGFVFDGDQGLYEGQFLVGLGPDNVIGQPYSSGDGTPPAEWTSTSGVTPIPPLFGFDQALETTFAAVSGDVAVRVRAYAAPDAAYVLLEYEVTNTSGGPLAEVYLGIFADWDVGNATQNRGAYIENTNLLFVSDESGTSTNVFGTIALDRSMTPVSGFSLSTETTDAGLYTALTTLGVESEPEADRRTILGVGPYALGTQESVEVRFALAGGSNRSALSSSALDAQSLVEEGTVLTESIEVGGFMRDYLLFVPFEYDGTQSRPLVVNFHGFATTGEEHMTFFAPMNAFANEQGFLVAYPNGLEVNDLVFGDTGLGWNVLGTYEAPHDDVAFTAALIEEVRQSYSVDAERIHATGWSNGSEMAFYVACMLADRVASVAGVAGPMNDALIAACETDQLISTLLIHGTADVFFPPEGIPMFHSPPEVTPAFWAAHNGCEETPSPIDLPDVDPTDSSTVTLLDYDCGDNAPTQVLYYRVDGGGHAWPGTNLGIDFLEPTNQDIDGNEVVWAFFQENPLVVSNEDDASLPSGTALHAAYPNPVVRATTLGFALPNAEHVRLTVHDVLGRRVAIVLDEVRPAGAHEVRFDAGRLASGAYLVRLQAGAASLTQRFVVVR